MPMLPVHDASNSLNETSVISTFDGVNFIQLHSTNFDLMPRPLDTCTFNVSAIFFGNSSQVNPSNKRVLMRVPKTNRRKASCLLPDEYVRGFFFLSVNLSIILFWSWNVFDVSNFEFVFQVGFVREVGF